VQRQRPCQSADPRAGRVSPGTLPERARPIGHEVRYLRPIGHSADPAAPVA